jgi:hypothetical protein
MIKRPNLRIHGVEDTNYRHRKPIQLNYSRKLPKSKERYKHPSTGSHFKPKIDGNRKEHLHIIVKMPRQRTKK